MSLWESEVLGLLQMTGMGSTDTVSPTASQALLASFNALLGKARAGLQGAEGDHAPVMFRATLRLRPALEPGEEM